ncbi:MAG TPA: DUF881 domain-containing protein [Egibacteraceae bacterium]|nr:DUF881 domain-containing protein [Egibacteraceae bacterium]
MRGDSERLSESPEAAAGPAGQPAAPTPLTRAAFALTLVLLVLVLVTAAHSRPATQDARLGRRVELVELIRAEQARVNGLAARVEELSGQIAAFEAQASADPELLAALQAEIAAMSGPAGLTPVQGPGLVVTLTDSSLEESSTGDLNDLVIHEQDLQAVINALWAGGAEAMSVNGQRVLATTAIRCVGNTLLLHGSVYSPPYQIRSVGDPDAMRAELARDLAVRQFQRAAEQFQLGFSVVEEEAMLVPAFEGSAGLRSARALGART